MEKPDDELTLIFVDRYFKHQISYKWDINGINRLKSYDNRMLKLLWAKYLESSITGLCSLYPKNWKSYDEYMEAWQKELDILKKENEKHIEENKTPLPQKTIEKRLPKFLSKLKREEVGIIFSTRKVKVWIKNAEDTDWKFFKKIINTYDL